MAGVPSLVLLAMLVAVPPGNASQQLSYVSGHGGLVTVFEFTVLLWATLSAPFAFSVGMLLRSSGRAIVRAATGLSAFGVLLLGFATYVNTGGLIALNAAGTPPTTGIDVYLATFWTQLGYLMTDPPLMAWGLGQMIFASVGWNSRAIPRWLAVVGGLAGLGLLLGSVDTPSQAIYLIAFGFLAFAVWALSIGVMVLRRGADRSLPV